MKSFVTMLVGWLVYFNHVVMFATCASDRMTFADRDDGASTGEVYESVGMRSPMPHVSNYPIQLAPHLHTCLLDYIGAWQKLMFNMVYRPVWIPLQRRIDRLIRMVLK